MGIKFSMKDLEPLIREALEKGSTFTMIPRGTSMMPLFREGIDAVILSPLPHEVIEGDIILYKRKNGQFVLHRVMKKVHDTYTMCGDNQIVFEKGIKKDMMIAMASGMIRDEDEIIFSQNTEYASYTKKLLREKKAKNLLILPKRIVKKILLKLHILKKREA